MLNQHTRKEFLLTGAIASIAFLLGNSEFGQQAASAAAPTADHPNVDLIKRYYDAYAQGDLGSVRQIFAPDIIWTIPGHHPLAGTKRGAEEVFAFFQQLAKARFRAEVLFLGGNDTYVVDVHRGYSNLERDNLDQLFALLFKIQNNRIVEVINFPSDQHAADAFFWRVYPLAPLPQRLAE